MFKNFLVKYLKASWIQGHKLNYSGVPWVGLLQLSLLTCWKNFSQMKLLT